jgi:hypothetical protein
MAFLWPWHSGRVAFGRVALQILLEGLLLGGSSKVKKIQELKHELSSIAVEARDNFKHLSTLVLPELSLPCASIAPARRRRVAESTSYVTPHLCPKGRRGRGWAACPAWGETARTAKTQGSARSCACGCRCASTRRSQAIAYLRWPRRFLRCGKQWACCMTWLGWHLRA